MKSIKTKIFDWYSVELCTNNRNTLIVYADNSERWGNGGMAVIRNQCNSMGISTKDNPHQYMSDERYEKNCSVIDVDIMLIKEQFHFDPTFEYIGFPKASLGTGLSNMQQECPKTFFYLCKRLLEVFNYNNVYDLVNSTTKRKLLEL